MSEEIRLASAEEDALLSRILANAFLPIWNHNWMQNIASPVPTLPYYTQDGHLAPLTKLQERRRKFYHALIKMTRLAGGTINVSTMNGAIVAILLWLLPDKRASFWDICKSGFARIALWDYGLVSLWRVQMVFEYNLTRIARDNHVREHKYAYVQMLAVHPSHAGHGYAARLLQKTIEKNRKEFPNCLGVMLDSTTLSARALYKSLGFVELGTRIIDSGCDRAGFRMSKRDPDYASKRKEALCMHEQVLMLLKT